MKLFKLLLLLVIPSLIFHPLQAYEGPSYEEIMSVFQRDTALIRRISIDGIPNFDLVMSLVDDLENDTLDENIDIQELAEFVVLLIRLGFSGTEEEWEELERDNRALLEGIYDDDEEDEYYYEDAQSFRFGHAEEIILCGFKKSAKNIWKGTKKGAKKFGHHVKDHKKAYIIGGAVVLGAVGLGLGAAAIAGASAGAATAATDKPSKHEEKKQEHNSAELEALPDSNIAIIPSHEQEQIKSFKDDVVQQLPITTLRKTDELSLLEKARDLGSYIAHQALVGAAEITSFVPQLIGEVKDLGSHFILDSENSTDFKSIENFENAIAHGHQIIDKAFSTDIAKLFTPEVKEEFKNNFNIGILPPPLSVLSEFTVSTNRLLEAGKALDRAGFTKAGRGLMKHSYRDGSIFPKPFGNPEQINAHGQKVLESILNHPERKVFQENSKKFGKIIDIYAPDIGGVRYSADGKFIGFLEP